MLLSMTKTSKMSVTSDQAKSGYTFGQAKSAMLPNVNTAGKVLPWPKNTELPI